MIVAVVSLPENAKQIENKIQLLKKKKYHAQEAYNTQNQRKVHSALSQEPKYNNYNFFNEGREDLDSFGSPNKDDNNVISVNAYIKSNKQNLKNFVSNLKTTDGSIGQKSSHINSSNNKHNFQNPVSSGAYVTQNVNKNHVENKK